MKLKIVGTLEDRSELSDEMADMCEEIPIYFVVEGRRIRMPWPNPQKLCLGNVGENNREIDCSNTV